jgi:seryl-tRNA synthetase
MKIAPGIPNLAPFKEEMLDAMERKMNMDKEMEQHIKELRNASRTLPQGTLENYAANVQAKVNRFEEETKKGGLTDQEIKDATNLMVKVGEINDPEARKMAQSRRAYYKELKKVVDAADVLI